MWPDSKDLSWKWVTADELLSHGPCDLLFAFLTAGAGNADATLYDGEDTNGRLIFTIEALQNVSQQAHLLAPAYCERGLYVDIGSNVTGIFVQWQERSKKGEGN